MSKSIPNSSGQSRWAQYFLDAAISKKTVPQPHHWWTNPRNHNSLRLNSTGYNWILDNCTPDVFRFAVDKPMTNRVLLQLDHLMTAPYYIRNRSNILLYGEQDAMMLSLHAGNLEQYLNNLKD